MQWILDRFEGEMAVLECLQDRTLVTIERVRMDEDAREGDILISDGEYWRVDADATKTRAEQIRTRMDRLWED